MNRSLVPYYVQNHADGQYPGYTLARYVGPIALLVRVTKTKTILDYGCGKGYQYTRKFWHHRWRGIMPTLYDPAVKEFSELPEGKFDGVVCTDVLEHIPEEELDEVISELVNYAEKWCYIAVCCRKAQCKLRNGMNEHVTIKPPRWWKEKLRSAFARSPAKVHIAFTP